MFFNYAGIVGKCKDFNSIMFGILDLQVSTIRNLHWWHTKITFEI